MDTRCRERPRFKLLRPRKIDPFAPLPWIDGQRFLFRAVWDGGSFNSGSSSNRSSNNSNNNSTVPSDPSHRSQRTSMRSSLPTEGLLSPMGKVYRRYFEQHLSPRSDLATAATPLVSWCKSYQRAARRCAQLHEQGRARVQMLIAWGGKLTLYDGETIASELSYGEEDVEGDGNGKDDATVWCSSSGSGRSSAEIEDHAGEVLSWGDEYVDDDTLVTHIDWSGSTVEVEDPWGARIPIPEFLIAPKQAEDVTWIQLRNILRGRLYWNFERTNFTRAVEHLLTVMAKDPYDLYDFNSLDL